MKAPQNRKEIATGFLTHTYSENVQEAFERFVYPDFNYHHVFFKGDRESGEASREALRL